ncbi:hypothetical protein DER46DRAFT_571029 [Fusarium sp. MPI-SDFR-AT-0072]|nr:hypothetical protein DER46DRAFT_571029 [Fusarium sp. MPI-SDFR-AT-0072]
MGWTLSDSGIDRRLFFLSLILARSSPGREKQENHQPLKEDTQASDQRNGKRKKQRVKHNGPWDKTREVLSGHAFPLKKIGHALVKVEQWEGSELVRMRSEDGASRISVHCRVL